jgi:hypothetical protein
VCRYGVFKVHAGRARLNGENRPERTVSQNSAAIVYFEVDILLGEPVIRTNEPEDSDINEPAASGVIAPESLERR